MNPRTLNTVLDCANLSLNWLRARNVAMENHEEETLEMCAHASAKLHELLTLQGIAGELVANDVHCYVLVGEVIVDVTANQFSSALPSVVLIEREKVDPEQYWWIEGVRFSDVREFASHLATEGWPEHQIPNEKETPHAVSLYLH